MTHLVQAFRAFGRRVRAAAIPPAAPSPGAFSRPAARHAPDLAGPPRRGRGAGAALLSLGLAAATALAPVFGAGMGAALLLAPAPAAAEAPSRAAPPPPRPSPGAARPAAMQASLAIVSKPTTAKEASAVAGGRSPRAEAPARALEIAAPVAASARLSGRIGFALMDLETGELLETREGDAAFPPASVAKLFSAAYALETLGPEHRFETRIQASAAPVNGRVAGDLALVGAGDPELDTDALAELAAQARARGLQQVSGRFVADVSGWPSIPYIDPEQPEEASYNPSVSALNLDFNRVLFAWERGTGGYELSMEARGARSRTAAQRVAIGLGAPARGAFERRDEPAREVWTVASGALGKDGQRWLPVRRPALHAAEVFRSFAAGAGLDLPAPETGAAPGGGVTLALRRSRELAPIVQDMLKYSTNLTAEAVGLGATASRVGPARDLAESGAAMSRWARSRAAAGAGLSSPPPAAPEAPLRVASAGGGAGAGAGPATGMGGSGAGLALAGPGAARPALSAGIAATMLARGAAAGPARVAGPVSAAGLSKTPDAAGPASGIALDLRNHSGLSEDSRVSPVATAAFLRAVERFGEGRARAGALRPLIKEYRLDPRKGETKVPASASAVAKTGTMYFVRGLAGYIDAASGRKLAFAIFSEDLARRDSLADTNDSGPSRGWLGRAREMERKMVRGWAAAY
ncbi:MAG: hypothetical protein CML43_08725 [Rhodobacteraceae bacterium]|nr:hypothetical protein [Paracoccaceae bacterium]